MPGCQQRAHRVEQCRFVQRFAQERVRARFTRAVAREQHAEDEYGNVARARIGFQSSAERESVEARHEDLRDHDAWVALARAFQGSPTQNPSILPTFMLVTICGGGIVMSVTSLSGLMPPAPSQ